jgi:hypothetical protein
MRQGAAEDNASIALAYVERVVGVRNETIAP